MRKVVGIIAEYNPFHNGHLYQINKVKEMYDNPIIILVMSGNFTQRGEVSIINKWDKTEIALLNGIDLVVELPFSFATQSADVFSHGALKILNELQIEYLVFGSEENNIEKLLSIAKVMNELSYEEVFKRKLSGGLSYPKAHYLAIKDLLGYELTTPNDLLGLSYVKQIINSNYNIIPAPIKRTNDYHNTKLENTISSASSIRLAIKNNQDIKSQIPENSFSYYQNLHFQDDYFPLLKFTIINNFDNLERFFGVNNEISTRIKKFIVDSSNYDDLIKSVKTKRYTYLKISRILNNILCGFTKEKQLLLKDQLYIRLLGFTKSGQEHLNKVKNTITIPIYSKFISTASLNYELQTTMIYNFNNLSKINDEYKKELIRK